LPRVIRLTLLSSPLADQALKSSKTPIHDLKGNDKMHDRKAVSRWRCVMGMAGWILLSSSVSASGTPSAGAPGQHIDLATYKLQTPIAKHDSVEEVTQPALHDFVAPFFYFDASTNAMVFNCPDNGAPTRGSHFPRSELRDTNEWKFSGQHTLSASLAVTQQPSSGNIIVGQIHGDELGTEALKIRWSKGDVVVGIKANPGSKEERFTLVRGLALGDRIDYRIAQSDHIVTVTVNGISKSFTYDHSWDGDTVYFKAGNYLQDNSASGSVGVVKFYALSSH
jgi:Alginate lyase